MPSKPHGVELDPVKIGFLVDLDVGVKDNFIQPFQLAFEEVVGGRTSAAARTITRCSRGTGCSIAA